MSCIDQNNVVSISIISFMVGMIIPPLFGYCMRKIPPPFLEETETLFA